MLTLVLVPLSLLIAVVLILFLITFIFQPKGISLLVRDLVLVTILSYCLDIATTGGGRILLLLLVMLISFYYYRYLSR